MQQDRGGPCDPSRADPDAPGADLVVDLVRGHRCVGIRCVSCERSLVEANPARTVERPPREGDANASIPDRLAPRGAAEIEALISRGNVPELLERVLVADAFGVSQQR